MRMTGQQKWAAACGAQMFIIGVFGTPHGALAQDQPFAAARPVSAAMPASATPGSEPASVRCTTAR